MLWMFYENIKNISLHKISVIIILFFGILYALITPPFQAPDEYNHFFRAYGIAQGVFIPIKVNKSDFTNFYDKFLGSNIEASPYLVGSFIPNNLLEMTRNISDDIPGKIKNKQDIDKIFLFLSKPRIKNDSRVFVNYPNSSLYSPVPYFPAVLGIITANIFQVSYLYMLYFGRIFNVVFFTLLGYLILKLIPAQKTLIFLILLMPMTLFLGAVISPDGMVIGLSLLIFSLTLNLSNQFNEKKFYLLVFASFLLGLSKSAYFLLPLCSIVLSFGNKKISIYKSFLPGLASLTGVVIWSILSKDLYIPLRNGVNPGLQLQYILQNPIEFFVILTNTFVGNRRYIINQFVGNFGWLDTPLNYYVCLLYVLVIIFSTLTDKRDTYKVQKLLIGLIGIITTIVVSIFLYLSWSPVGHPEILGLVGKNFIPVVFFCFYPLSLLLKIKHEYFPKWLMLLVVIGINIYSLYTLISRFYI